MFWGLQDPELRVFPWSSLSSTLTCQYIVPSPERGGRERERKEAREVVEFKEREREIEKECPKVLLPAGLYWRPGANILLAPLSQLGNGYPSLAAREVKLLLSEGEEPSQAALIYFSKDQ